MSEPTTGGNGQLRTLAVRIIEDLRAQLDVFAQITVHGHLAQRDGDLPGRLRRCRHPGRPPYPGTAGFSDSLALFMGMVLRRGAVLYTVHPASPYVTTFPSPRWRR